jgi:hypothetical protein
MEPSYFQMDSMVRWLISADILRLQELAIASQMDSTALLQPSAGNLTMLLVQQVLQLVSQMDWSALCSTLAGIQMRLALVQLQLEEGLFHLDRMGSPHCIWYQAWLPFVFLFPCICSKALRRLEPALDRASCRSSLAV